MATTSAFGWETPDDTDLVKDGAAAIRTLGNSIDTSMSELKGGTTGQILSKTSNTDMDFTWVAPTTGDITGVSVTSPITGGGTSGDVTIGIASSAVVPSQTGNSGKYLTTDGTNSSWGTISAGGMTLLATTNAATLTTITFSSISQSYKHLLVTWDYIYNSGGSGSMYFTVNNGGQLNWASTDNNNGSINGSVAATSYWQYFATPNNSTPGNTGHLWIFDYASTRYKPMVSNAYGYSTASSSLRGYDTYGMTDFTTAVTRVDLNSTVTMGGGQVRLWGVA